MALIALLRTENPAVISQPGDESKTGRVEGGAVKKTSLRLALEHQLGRT